MTAGVFPRVPPSGPGFYATSGALLLLLAGIAVMFASIASDAYGWFLLAALLAVFAGLVYGLARVRFEISPAGLAIRGLYGRSIPRADLDVDRAAAVDLAKDPARSPSVRTTGLRIPGCQTGWTQLKNGEKALVFVTDKRQVVYIPTRRGYSLLLSVVSPPEFLAALRGA